MKLSMWMILNRLEYLDPEIHIRPEAPRNLRSAHRTYATNCVHVFPGENGDVFSPDSAPSLAQLMEKYIGLVGEKKLPLTVKPNRMPCLFEDTLRKALGELDAR